MADGEASTSGQRAIAGTVLVLVVAGAVGGAVVEFGTTETDTTETTNAAVVGVSGNTTVTVTYTTASGQRQTAVVDGVDPNLSNATSGWALLDASALPPALRDSNRTANVVPVGGRVLVGNASSSTRPVGETTVRVVAPAGTGVDPARKSYFISEFLSPYRFGSNRTTVTLVAAPETLPHEGLMYADGTGYVTIDAFWDGDVSSVWVHEMVHARQSFTVESEMDWVREASAEYLTYRVLQEQYDAVTDEDVRARLDAVPAHHDARLSRPATWDGESVADTKGVRLLYAIDATVRDGSDGERTLFDVFRAMNQHEGPLSREEFRRIVESHSGNDEAWVERAITDAGSVGRYEESANVFEE